MAAASWSGASSMTWVALSGIVTRIEFGKASRSRSAWDRGKNRSSSVAHASRTGWSNFSMGSDAASPRSTSLLAPPAALHVSQYRRSELLDDHDSPRLRGLRRRDNSGIPPAANDDRPLIGHSRTEGRAGVRIGTCIGQDDQLRVARPERRASYVRWPLCGHAAGDCCG